MNDRTKYVDLFFRVIHLAFWPILWYKWIAITNTAVEFWLILIYAAINSAFILFLVVTRIANHTAKDKKFFYRLITAVCFLVMLISFVLYPKNLPLLYSKLLLILVYFIVSLRLVRHYKDDEGVVGIMSSLLIAAITYFY